MRIRIAKREDIQGLKAVLIRFAAIILALVAGAVFIAVLRYNPLTVYGKMLSGALGNTRRILSVITEAVPLAITALGISIAFKMKFWNIGGEGQVTMGAFAASFFALNFSHWPKGVLIPVMILVGMLAGGLWALIPAWFKAKYNTNETLFTLMLNYIAIEWVLYLQSGPWRDPNQKGMNAIAPFEDSAILPNLFGVHIGWIFALVLAVLIYIFMKRTKKGYEIQVIGESENTARYAGMNVKKVVIGSVFASGAICGLAGMIKSSAISRSLHSAIAGNVGFTGIIIAWLAQLSAPMILVVSFLFSCLVKGGDFIQIAIGLQKTVADMLQGLILFFVLGSEFFIQYKVIFDLPKKEKDLPKQNEEVEKA